VTRGAEGLLEMTAIKMLLVQRGRSTWYMDPTRDADAPMFEAAIRVLHGRAWRERLTAVASVLKSVRKYLRGK
jgi:hypothetical protein